MDDQQQVSDRSPAAVARVEGQAVVLDDGTVSLTVASLTVPVDQLDAIRATDLIDQRDPLQWGRDFIEGLAAAFREAAQTADRFVQPFEQLRSDTPPADPQVRALWLRQRRNTGPQQHRRTPRAITPRRAR